MENFDLAQTFQIENQNVRGRVVRLGPALDKVLTAHAYPDAVADMLAEILVIGATLASALKYDGLFTLQVQSDGPISLLVADLTSDGDLRGYARFDADRVADAANADGAKVPRLLGNGHLAFTVDQGADMDRYQGVVALEGGTLAVCAQNYFRASEQLETVLYVAVQNHAAGAMMVQRMPGESAKADFDEDEAEENWRRAVTFMASMKPEELLDDTLSTDDLLYRLYHEDGVRIYPSTPLQAKCRCSLEKVSNTLKSFPRAEIIDEAGAAQVVCEFCKTSYDFAPADLDGLFAKKA